jgi:nitric oxide dioxygenase
MTSFILEPEDGTALPQFSPGQYVSVKVRPPGLSFDQIRQYSLSAVPDGHQFRITVKREDAPAGSSDVPPGAVSTYLHRLVREGDTVLVHTPGGNNVLDESSTSPVVLMSGGAGITAVLGMLEYLAKNTDREVLWVHTAKSRDSDSFGTTVRALAASRRGIRCIRFYETIGPDDVQGKDFDVAGRIDTELLCTHLPAGNPEFYYCGPIGFTAATEHVLDELGVPVQRRHSEAFAPDESFGVRSPSIYGK